MEASTSEEFPENVVTSETIELPTAESEISTVEPEAPEAEVDISAEPEIPAVEPEPVVLEGAHSRLIYDPATGEYKYEFK